MSINTHGIVAKLGAEKVVCNEKICLDKGNGKCGNICKYLD